MKKTLIAAAIAATSLFGLSASATDFSVMENTSSAQFTSSAPLETVTGTTSAVNGDITADLSDPTSLRGTVTIPVASIRTGVDLRDEHLQGEQWLNAAEHPNLEFEVTSVRRRGGARSLGHNDTANVLITGNMTIHGVTRELTVPAQVTYYVIEGSELEGSYGITSNILRVSATFDIELDDFGVNVPGPLQAKVSNELSLQVRLTAAEQ